jgi:hypothetical protein
VDKTLFIKVLNRYTESSAEEAQEIIALKAAFPYSQLLHTLSARVSKDHHLPAEQASLQMAAVYAADRSVLKEILTQTTTTSETKEIDQAVAINTAVINETIDSIGVVEELAFDLKRLNELKHNFEMLFMDNQKVKVALPVINNEEHLDGVAKEHHKSKKERIIELARSLSTSDNVDEKTIIKHSLLRRPKKGKDSNPVDELIEEIKITKQEITPENEKQKEQIDLIDQFIKIQPSISSAKERVVNPIGDLNPIKPGEFSDNIVSETLVDILIKQGKKDRAIEVLKKLIWKFPQKKNYFATQIENLRS